MISFLFTHVKREPTTIKFIDSTSIKVCHNLRIPKHNVFKKMVSWGKGTEGWFYGFKFHIITNHLGDVVAAKLIQPTSMTEFLYLNYPKDYVI
ncbi:transposase [Vibrio sp. ES.051]|uniref:transposase n=1 Tax=Vibrio sp. ES.051 TaxID=1761909 RepID=UPI0015CF5162